MHLHHDEAVFIWALHVGPRKGLVDFQRKVAYTLTLLTWSNSLTLTFRVLCSAPSCVPTCHYYHISPFLHALLMRAEAYFWAYPMLRIYWGAEVSLLRLCIWLKLLSLESVMTFLEEEVVSCLHSLVKLHMDQKAPILYMWLIPWLWCR